MTRDERISIFKRDLDALMRADDGLVIFNLAQDEDSYVQFSRERADAPLLCEVSNRSEGWNAHSLDSAQVAELRALGYEIPSPHHQATPHKEFSGDVAVLAEEIERIFRIIFRAPENYDVVSNGVES
jgi:hypothetical protein